MVQFYIVPSSEQNYINILYNTFIHKYVVTVSILNIGATVGTLSGLDLAHH